MSRVILLSLRAEQYEPPRDPLPSAKPILFEERYEGPRSRPEQTSRPSFFGDLLRRLRRLFASEQVPPDPNVAPVVERVQRVERPEEVGEVARELEASIRKSPYIGFEAGKDLIRDWIDRHIASGSAVDAGDLDALRGIDPEVLRQAARYLQTRAQSSDDGAVGRNVREAAQEYAARLDTLAGALPAIGSGR